MTSKPFGAGIKCLVYSTAYLQFKLAPLPFGSDCRGSWLLLESYCLLIVVDFWCRSFNWKHSSCHKQYRIVAYFCKVASYVSLKMCSCDWYIGHTLVTCRYLPHCRSVALVQLLTTGVSLWLLVNVTQVKVITCVSLLTESVLVVAVPHFVYTWQVDVWLSCVCVCVWTVSIVWCFKWWGCIFLLWCFCLEAWKIIQKMEWPNEMTLTFLHLYQACQTWSLKSFMVWLYHILIYIYV